MVTASQSEPELRSALCLTNHTNRFFELGTILPNSRDFSVAGNAVKDCSNMAEKDAKELELERLVFGDEEAFGYSLHSRERSAPNEFGSLDAARFRDFEEVGDEDDDSLQQLPDAEVQN